MNNEKKVYVDYIKKIEEKFYILKEENKEFATDLNSLIIFLNYCFKNRNGFFVTDFNSKNIVSVNQFYNELKTNILKDIVYVDIKQFFEGIDKYKISNIVFILKNFIYKYKAIEDNEIKNVCSQKSMKNILDILKSL